MGPSRQIDLLDGRPESWSSFQKAPYKLLDKEGYGWVVEGGDVFCVMLQAASAKAAQSTVTSGKGTVATNEADYHKEISRRRWQTLR
jgi:phosphoribosylamine-glycine ligase